jgi:hypothetical protein
MTKLDWHFEPVSSMGGASAGAYQNSLAGAGVPPDELFAREVIQNSVDAASQRDASVLVRFRSRRLADGERAGVLSSLGLESGSEPLKRKGLVAKGELGALLGGPLEVLYVEDYNTLGLGGTTKPLPLEEEDNYFRLCLTLGDTRAGQGGGGTFGYGKSVFWQMSSVWTVVMYSRFAPTARTNGANARLIGISWFKTHSYQRGKTLLRYTGRAWLGEVHEEGCNPLVDDAAHAAAAKLGFALRGDGECGLSVMILGSRVDTDKLRDGVERHWWPRLLDGKLAVELERDDTPAEKPQPRARPALKRFVRAWDLARGAPVVDGRDARQDLSYRSEALGVFAMTTGPESEPEEFGSTAEAEPAEIALVREPRMVVEYLPGPVLGSSQPLCNAVFVANPALNQMFAASEPPAHNKWDYRTIRQDRPLSEEQKRKIKHALDKIRAAARAFVQRRQSPPMKPPERCRELERMLGKFIRIDPELPPPPPPGGNPVSIRFLEPAQRSVAGAGVTIDAKVRVALRDDANLPLENLVRVYAWVDTIVDDGSTSDKLAMDYIAAKDADGTERLGEVDTRGSYVDLVLEPGGEGATIDLRSAVLPHAEYRTSLKIVAEVFA